MRFLEGAKARRAAAMQPAIPFIKSNKNKNSDSNRRHGIDNELNE